MNTEKAIKAIVKAIESANHGMFWDVIIDEEDIRERLLDQPEYYTEKEKAESVISSIMMSHEETLVNASREQARRAEKVALSNLKIR